MHLLLWDSTSTVRLKIRTIQSVYFPHHTLSKQSLLLPNLTNWEQAVMLDMVTYIYVSFFHSLR